MELFRKRKIKVDVMKEEKTEQTVNALPKPSIPDSQQLMLARQKAEEEIRSMEQKIAQERELWSQKIKEKAEESIGLRAQIETIVNRSNQERDKSERKINTLKKQVENELIAAEKDLESEIVKWNERISYKENEIEEVKNRSEYDESRIKMESEQHIRKLSDELESTENERKALERRFLEEQNRWITKLKSREEEVINLRAQISLRETQLNDEDEKIQVVRKEMESGWDGKIKEAETKLEGLRKDWTSRYTQKEADIIALKTAFEKRLSFANMEKEQKENEIRKIQERAEDNIRIIENSFSEEKMRWQEMLKDRDEQFNKLKVELMLRESQDKTEREKKAQEFKEAETFANKKLLEIKQKMEEEKASWGRTLAAREEEIKVFKIQAELKLNEMHAGWEKRKEEIEKEKNTLQKRISEIDSKFNEEKKCWQEELSSKNDETAKYEKEWQEKQSTMAALGEQQIVGHKVRNELLEKELSKIEANLQEEKTKWEILLSEGQNTLELLRKEAESKESALDSELSSLETSLTKGQEPLYRNIRELEFKLSAMKNQYKTELSTKESRLNLLKDMGKRQDESFSKRLEFRKEKIKEIEVQLNSKIDEIKAQKEAYLKHAEETILELNDKSESLKQNIQVASEKSALEKSRMIEHFNEQKLSLLQSIEKSEQEYNILKQNLDAELQEKENLLAVEESNRKAREKAQNEEIVVKEKALEESENRSTREIAAFQAQTLKEKENYDNEIKLKEESVTEMQRTLRENKAAYQADIENLRREFENETKPIYQKRQELNSALIKEKKTAEAKFAEIVNIINKVRQQETEKELEHENSKTAILDKNNNIKIAFHKSLDSLKKERAALQEQLNRYMANAENDQVKYEKEIADSSDEFKNRKASIIMEAKVLKDSLHEEIQSLQKEIIKLETETPKIIENKQKEFAALEKQLSQKITFYKQQRDEAEKSLEVFQVRAEHRMGLNTQQFKELEEHNKAEMSAAENKLEDLRAQMAIREKAQNEDLEKCGKIFAEERYRFTKQKTELEEQLRGLQSVSREQLRIKEKEILSLQSELSEKEKYLEQTWKQKERELTDEKNIILQEMKTVESRLTEEQNSGRLKINEKEEEISKFEEQCAIRISNLTKEVAGKKQSWNESNTRLKEQVNGLTSNFEELSDNWNKERSAKEKELSDLKLILEQWELKNTTEISKRVSAWEREKTLLEGKVRETVEKIEAFKKGKAEKLIEKDKTQSRLKADYQKLETEKQLQWSEAESSMLKQREIILNETADWEKKTKIESEAIEKERKAIELEMEKLKLEAALKDTTVVAEKQKTERNRRKILSVLEDKMSALTRQLDEENDNWGAKIHLKDQEITTLELRLSMREERCVTEEKRRQEEILKIISELHEDFQTAKKRYNSVVPENRSSMESFKNKLKQIVQEIDEKNRSLKKNQDDSYLLFESTCAALKNNIEKLDEEVSNKITESKISLEKKSGKVKDLSNKMLLKENSLNIEREQTQALSQFLMQKSGEFRREIKEMDISMEFKKKEKLNDSFENAVELYNNEKFEESVKILLNIINIQPRFAGAYQYIALCYWNSGQQEDAINMAHRAFELEPHNKDLKSWIEFIEEKKASNS